MARLVPVGRTQPNQYKLAIVVLTGPYGVGKRETAKEC